MSSYWSKLTSMTQKTSMLQLFFIFVCMSLLSRVIYNRMYLFILDVMDQEKLISLSASKTDDV